MMGTWGRRDFLSRWLPSSATSLTLSTMTVDVPIGPEARNINVTLSWILATPHLAWEAEPCESSLISFSWANFCGSIRSRRLFLSSFDLGYLAHEFVKNQTFPLGALQVFFWAFRYMHIFFGLIHVWEISWKLSADVLGGWQCSEWGLRGGGPLDTPEKRW